VLSRICKGVATWRNAILGLQEGEPQEGLFPAPFDKSKTVFLHIFSPDEIDEALNGAGFVLTDRQVYESKPGQHQFNKGITFARKIDSNQF
jgi:hypothetical protein